ncbi:hypothetical protein Strvi_2607 [Streptomyces violaceusniger Tu 4113]|uniref:Uncharacterized protein n=1 Tax=Streptomyces violaceusniger (strain Tu 4113) TaxID=653045 RepID=G2PDM3_STRV4|nr:hypothetical protein Strvi_2607 [Streptomyces violaceusniger Tu 4113]
MAVVGLRWAEFDTEAALMRTLGRFEDRVDADRPLGDSLEEFTASEFHFPVRDWDLYRYNDWFLLSCVVLPWPSSSLTLPWSPSAEVQTRLPSSSSSSGIGASGSRSGRRMPPAGVDGVKL